MTPRLILATANPGKAAEFRALLTGLPYEIRSLADQPEITLPREDGASYAENARAKAQTVAAAVTDAVALGDDSGLEVDALGGRPGLGTARYSGPGLTDGERIDRLLAELAGAACRSARFRCVLFLAAPWGEEALIEGIAEGVLTDTPRGRGGFGYDPIFLVPEAGRTFAELGAAEKHRWSHRGRAVSRAHPVLLEWAKRATGRREPA